MCAEQRTVLSGDAVQGTDPCTVQALLEGSGAGSDGCGSDRDEAVLHWGAVASLCSAPAFAYTEHVSICSAPTEPQSVLRGLEDGVPQTCALIRVFSNGYTAETFVSLWPVVTYKGFNPRTVPKAAVLHS